MTADSAGTLWRYSPNYLGGFRARDRVGGGWSTLKAGFNTDWNADGLQDILAQWNDGRLTLYRGQYGGGFRAPVTIGRGWGSMDITVGKWLRGSRYPSVVARDGAGGLWHYANTTGGALSSTRSARIGGGWQGLRIAMADWDRDGNQDILATRTNGQLVLYRSNGQARFVGETRRIIGSGWQSMDSLTAVSGFQGPGSYGLRARTSSGDLRIYPMRGNSWGPSATIGRGWQSYNLFR